MQIFCLNLNTLLIEFRTFYLKNCSVLKLFKFEIYIILISLLVCYHLGKVKSLSLYDK